MSKNTELTNLYCSDNQLENLDVSKNTKLVVFDCSDNQLDTDSLNDLFGTLHSNYISITKNIYIGSNPGTNDCDRSIAEDKGWTVN